MDKIQRLMPLIAVTDIGTNTINFIAANCSNDKIEITQRERFTVKLGAGGFRKHVLTESAMGRSIDALLKIQNIIDELCPNQHICVATSAVRSATNASTFIRRIKQSCGITVKVIEGDKEAQLIAKGVLMSSRMALDTTILIMDIGGGSTEYILCSNGNIEWAKSYPTGASKMLAQHPVADPMIAEEIALYFDLYKNQHADLLQKIDQNKPKVLIGCSGSFHTFSKIHTASTGQEPERNGHLVSIPIRSFKKIYNMLLFMTFEERIKVKGLSPFRAELINVAGIQIASVLSYMKATELWYSEYAIKEGLLYPFVKH